jgi:hypothetical protein
MYRTFGTYCCIHTVVPPDDGPRYGRNMWRLTKYTKNKLCIKLFFFTTVTEYFFANKVPKMLFFCADYIFTTYVPLADEKENNFSRKFVRRICRIYPCNDTNKLLHGSVSHVMNIWKLLLCSELLCTCWPQFLAALYLCHYISQSFLAEYALLLNVTRCLNYQDDIFDATYTNSRACWIQSCQLSISHS